MTEQPNTIVVRPRPPVVVSVSPPVGYQPATDVIEVDGSRRGPVGPTLPLVWNRQGPCLVLPGKMTYRFPFAATLSGISAACGLDTPPIGGDLKADIKVNGHAVFTVVIPDGESEQAEAIVDIPVFIGDRVTVDITDVGALTTPGSDLSIFIRYEI